MSNDFWSRTFENLAEKYAKSYSLDIQAHPIALSCSRMVKAYGSNSSLPLESWRPIRSASTSDYERWDSKLKS